MLCGERAIEESTNPLTLMYLAPGNEIDEKLHRCVLSVSEHQAGSTSLCAGAGYSTGSHGVSHAFGALVSYSVLAAPPPPPILTIDMYAA